MSNPVQPIAIGSLAVDCSALASFIVDLPPGTLRGMLVERPGFADAIAEILANQATIGPKAGVTQDEVDAIALAGQRIEQIDAVLPAVQKLLEMLVETRAKLEDQRQRGVHAIGGMLEGRARTMNDPTTLAKYEKTRAYRSATGIKAAKTRKKKIEAGEHANP